MLILQWQDLAVVMVTTDSSRTMEASQAASASQVWQAAMGLMPLRARLVRREGLEHLEKASTFATSVIYQRVPLAERGPVEAAALAAAVVVAGRVEAKGASEPTAI